MSEELKSVTVYATFVEAIDGVCKNDAEKGKMYSAIMRYALYGEEPELNSVLLAVFSLMKPAIDKSKMRKLCGAKRKQNESKIKANEKQNESDIYLNDNISTSSSISSSNSLSVSFSYPESVDDVLKAAERAGAVISRQEAERYFVCRMSSNWVDAAGRKVKESRIGFDIKRWILNNEKSGKSAKGAEKGKAQREVDYVPKF